MPKAIRFLIIISASIIAFSISSQASIIYQSFGSSWENDNLPRTFTVYGDSFTFQPFGSMEMAKCPNPLTGMPETCHYSQGGIWADGNGIVSDGYAANFPAGSEINSLEPYRSNGLMLAVQDFPMAPYYTYGSWYQGWPGYLGFRVSSSDGMHYGWAQIEIDGFIPYPAQPDDSFYAMVEGYAYESCPDQAIIAGQTSGGASCVDPPDPPDPMPESGTAISLLVGLAGLAMYGLAKDRISWYQGAI